MILYWKCYCPECHRAFVNPKAIAENLKVAYIDFKCQGCGQRKNNIGINAPRGRRHIKRIVAGVAAELVEALGEVTREALPCFCVFFHE